jgi:hypothetical protein
VDEDKGCKEANRSCKQEEQEHKHARIAEIEDRGDCTGDLQFREIVYAIGEQIDCRKAGCEE